MQKSLGKRSDRNKSMFDKRLMEMAPEARAYIIASVILQWVALLANIGFVMAV